MAQNHSNNPNTKTKGKLWIVFLILLALTLSVTYYSYDRFTALTEYIERLSQPDHKIEILNKTFTDLVEAENHIQSFILTGDSAMQNHYHRQIESVRHRIEELRAKSLDDPHQLKRIDSLQSLLQIKLEYLAKFLQVKEKKQQSIFTSEALKQIHQELTDTSFVLSQLLKREFIKGSVVPVEKEEVIVIPDKYEGIGGFFRKLVGADRTRTDTLHTIEEEWLLSKEVQIDTSVIKDYHMDSTLMRVNAILNPIMNKELALREQLTKTELALLRQDRVFISKIRHIIDELRKDERAESINKKLALTMSANQSIRSILAIGLLGFFMSSFFLFLVLKDVTRAYFYRKSLEAEKLRVEKLAKVKEEFMANMSHEIRTPLHSISGFSNLMEQTSMDDKQKKYMKAIDHSNGYLSELINNILDQAKIDAGKLVLSNTPFDITSILEELKSMFEYSALEKKIRFHTEFTGDYDKLELIGDPLRIKQILTNLLANAFKFTEKGTVSFQVSITLQKTTCRLQAVVKDTGVGIPQEYQKTIFEQFHQQPGHDQLGTGLGLSLTKSLTTAMGGQISLTSQPNEGSAFTVLFHLPYKEGKSSTLPKERPVETWTSEAHVVLVDDDRWNAILLEETLKKYVRKVTVFNRSYNALSYLREQRNEVSMLFTDVRMPDMAGPELLKQMQKENINIPTVAVTAHFQKDKLEDLKNIGFAQVCSKPFQKEDILSILKVHLKQSAIAGSQLRQEGAVEFSIPDHPVFDFSSIYKFAGGERLVFERLVTDLAANNKRQLDEFDSFVSEGNTQGLADLCHQLRTSYDQLGVEHISELLMTIELYHQTSQSERALTTAKELMPELMQLWQQLNNFIATPQYYIS